MRTLCFKKERSYTYLSFLPYRVILHCNITLKMVILTSPWPRSLGPSHYCVVKSHLLLFQPTSSYQSQFVSNSLIRKLDMFFTLLSPTTWTLLALAVILLLLWVVSTSLYYVAGFNNEVIYSNIQHCVNQCSGCTYYCFTTGLHVDFTKWIYRNKNYSSK